MEYSLLKYPKKSHRKIVHIPEDSKDLAELFGIAFGDGGINNNWQLVITLNAGADMEYSKYVDELLRKLFKIDVYIRKRPNMNALVLVCSRSNLVDFLVNKGAARGNKVIQQIDIPKWINDNPEYQKSFVRGLVDTDGCLFIHKHVVGGVPRANIGFCFTNSSKKLILSVARILKEFGIDPHITDEGRRIYLYSINSITSYLDIFGSSNPRISKKYLEWINMRRNQNEETDHLYLESKVWRDARVV